MPEIHNSHYANHVRGEKNARGYRNVAFKSDAGDAAAGETTRRIMHGTMPPPANTPTRTCRTEKMNSVEERIAAWLGAIPGAISGSGGHNQTFRVACTLYNSWGLSETETLRWLERYNERCQPPWSASELKHKASGAVKAKHTKPCGHLVRDEPRFRTTPVPIRQPVKDTRPPIRGKLAKTEWHGDHTSFPLLTVLRETDEPNARVYVRKRKTCVTCVPKIGKTEPSPF
jgi:hypothetical protein